MESAPLVSVILATYNWPGVLSYAIRSVLWQTFQDFELLVIGDCCTDDTETVVHSFQDPRIRWHNLPQNSGNQCGPNNAGLERARGKYIAYMHQDDLWLPSHLQVLVSALETANLSAAHALCLQISPVSFDSEERIRVIMGLSERNVPRAYIYAPMLMHRKDTIDSVGGWRDWRMITNTPTVDLIERLSKVDGRILTVPEVTVIKFNSAERPNSYIDQPCYEQEIYFHRIEQEPDLLYRETLLALEALVGGKRSLSVLPFQENRAAGWEIAQYRRLRGLPYDAIHQPSLRFSFRGMARSLRSWIPMRKNLGTWMMRIGRFLSDNGKKA